VAGAPQQDDLFGGLPLALPPSKNPKKSAKRADSAADVKSEEKSNSALKTIGETAKIIAVEQHVLRFWESKFSNITPLKMSGGRRYYRPEDMDILIQIKDLLHNQGYTIKGVQKFFGLQEDHEDAENKKSKPPELSTKTRKELTEIYQDFMEMRQVLQNITNL